VTGPDGVFENWKTSARPTVDNTQNSKSHPARRAIFVALLIIDFAAFDSYYSTQITEAVERGLNKFR
jgi:hypothetical protein